MILLEVDKCISLQFLKSTESIITNRLLVFVFVEKPDVMTFFFNDKRMQANATV